MPPRCPVLSRPTHFLPSPLWLFFSTSAMFMNPKLPQESVGNPEAMAWFSRPYRVRISPAQATLALQRPTLPRSLTPNLSSHIHHTLASSCCAPRALRVLLALVTTPGGWSGPWKTLAS